MDLLPIMKDSGYTKAQYINFDQEVCTIRLNQFYSNDEIFLQLRMDPASIQYFPLDRTPYITFMEKEKVIKLQLLK
ncbi:hypothetical protein [Halobacillus sp. A5]|uniref:hypothetical protein n=1 Tax=Halobacillus sp. A5 TaxID=2880263 RepID=UPI0020A62A23|nr:hypothetical protein [Halobacillus sp. A5]MCP3026555.1 hypothetical protein [Halobacillus sp. A5]